MDFKIIIKEYSLDDPLQKLLNPFALLNKMAARAKYLKTFKRRLLLNLRMDFEVIIRQCSLGDLYQNALTIPLC